MKFREALGEILRELRKEQDKTLESVAEKANISIGYLSEVERGKKEISSELIFALCAALQVPLWMVINKVSSRLYSSMEQISKSRITQITSRSITSPEGIHHLHPGEHNSDNKFQLYAA